ncbi:MAG: transglycosylase SLT domain-containing protein [Desulfuromonadaceae bacterium]|nr:transglycosylase SLT domain-containing protein [Desulfuromonadaceae bacterium]MDD2849887.1 transglycosylase SLT domain-containing protein [Desulfuromonadaceae bacterium]MDD4130702.1 transglycosylase SLT domain-containing protein [Desulfuromonadaceae bacterium]
MGNDAAPAKPIQLPYSLIMRKKLIYLACLLLLTACENAPFKLAEIQSTSSLATEPSILDSSNISLTQRKRQQEVIEAAFSRRTSVDRAQKLAAICFDKTIGTVFMPFDLAEIALVETGGHRLSARAVSTKGALGVWQLMPRRAKSHGYTPQDMLDDSKCAEAAVCELYTKLDMAKGNLERAKKYYCGQGPQANAYIKKIRVVRQEMIAALTVNSDKLAMAD